MMQHAVRLSSVSECPADQLDYMLTDVVIPGNRKEMTHIFVASFHWKLFAVYMAVCPLHFAFIPCSHVLITYAIHS
jgi:hypothetical protein